MSAAEVLIVALTWLGVGIAMTALWFNIKENNEKVALLKEIRTLLKRNEELIADNKELISYNNRALDCMESIQKSISYISNLLKN